MGLLDKTIIIKRKGTAVPDGSGGWTSEYVQIGSVSGRISPISASTQLSYAQLGVTVSHTITILPGASLSADDLLEYQGRVFSIKGGVNPGEKNHHIKLTCEEVKGDGI